MILQPRKKDIEIVREMLISPWWESSMSKALSRAMDTYPTIGDYTSEEILTEKVIKAMHKIELQNQKLIEDGWIDYDNQP